MRSLLPSRSLRAVSPMTEMRRLMSQFDDIFRDAGSDNFSERNWPERNLAEIREFSPLVDIEENEEMFLISTDLPGIKKEDVKIDISGNMLKISGKRRREVKEEGYYERSSGQFYRSFTLPDGVDTKKVEANFEDGVLKIVLPKTEIKEPLHIKIQSGPTQGMLDRFLHKEKPATGEGKSKH